MDCCSSNSNGTTSAAPGMEIESAAENLAGLLKQSDEYQEFARLANLIHLDPDVTRIMSNLRLREQAGAEAEELDALGSELEALPAVQAYRQTEKAMQALFRATDQLISTAAGVRFAPNAQRSGCG